MNTNHGIASNSMITGTQSAPPVARPIVPTPPQPTSTQQAIPSLVQVMQKVKTDTPEAKLNKHSIDDGNGGRIEMNDDDPKNHTLMGSIDNQVW